VKRVDEGALIPPRGNTHPKAARLFVQSAASPVLPLLRMLVVLKLSDSQKAAFEKLLDDPQDRGSPSYHQWLTADQFGQQFGPSDQDMQTIAAWLRSHGFQVTPISHWRPWLSRHARRKVEADIDLHAMVGTVQQKYE
jgi:hypothetical protein